VAAATAALDWAEKHRPRRLADIVGNKSALEELNAWADAWASGTPPAERGVILAGEPGVGKTTAAHALAAERGWSVVELNASDQRNEEVIRRIATSGAVNASILSTGDAKQGRQLVLLDEADNLFGREDRGGMKAILDTLRVTKQPIVLIANDLYELTRKAGALKTLARTIKFTRVYRPSIPAALKRIADAENVAVEPEALKLIAERSGGDMRSAVNDLQALAMGRTRLLVADVEALGRRDTTGDVWGLLGKVFLGRNLDEARKTLWTLDETPESVSLWIDENIPVLYLDPADRLDAFAILARADIFLGRVSRRQHYGLWSYAGELMTAGVAVAKVAKPASARFQFPGWLRKQSASKGMRELRKRVAGKVAMGVHTSPRQARESMFPFLRALMEKDDEFAGWVAAEFELEKDEIAFLLEARETTARVKAIHEAASKRLEAKPRETARAFAGYESDEAEDAGDEEDEAIAPVATDEDDEEEVPAKTAKTPAKAASKEKPDAASKETPKKADAKDDAKRQRNLFDF